ncbi:MAG: hypothetical protein KAT70_07650 [Thermoplasmata archaeon]|nr:hypothetical protein [Thermoplasmata archaeon]
MAPKKKPRKKPAKARKPKMLSMTELADAWGVSRSRMSVLWKNSVTLRRTGKRVGRNYRINKAKALKVLRTERDPQQDGIKKKSRKKKDTNADTFQDARAMSTKYQAEHRRLDYLARAGELISREQAVKTAAEAGKQLKEALYAGVQRIAPQVMTGVTRFQAEQILRKEFNIILQNFSDAMRRIHEQG